MGDSSRNYSDPPRVGGGRLQQILASGRGELDNSRVIYEAEKSQPTQPGGGRLSRLLKNPHQEENQIPEQVERSHYEINYGPSLDSEMSQELENTSIQPGEGRLAGLIQSSNLHEHDFIDQQNMDGFEQVDSRDYTGAHESLPYQAGGFNATEFDPGASTRHNEFQEEVQIASNDMQFPTQPDSPWVKIDLENDQSREEEKQRAIIQAMMQSQTGRETLSKWKKQATMGFVDPQQYDTVLDEYAAYDMKEVLESAVPMAIKREMAKRLVSSNDIDNLSPEEVKRRYQVLNKQLDANKRKSKEGTLPSLLPGMKGVESRFGGTVVAVFAFIAWTAILNLAILLLIIGLIVVPQRVFDKQNGPEYADVECQAFENVWYDSNEISQCCSQLYQNQEMNVTLDHGANGFDFDDFLGVIQDLLQGTNWMEHSPFFIGFYSGTFAFEFSSFNYDFPLAYFLTMQLCFTIAMCAIVYSSARSFTADFQMVDNTRTRFTNLVLAGWDSKVIGKEGVKMQHELTRTKLKGTLQLTRAETRREKRTHSERLRIYTIRLGVNLLALGLLVGTAYLIFYLLSDFLPRAQSDLDCANQTGIFSSWPAFWCLVLEYAPSLVITATSLAFPYLFSLLIVYERYDDNTKLLVDLLRTFGIRMASLAIAFFSVYFTVKCDYEIGCADEEGQVSPPLDNDVLTCGLGQTEVTQCSNPRTVGSSYGFSECNRPQCWETFLGQQLYKLTVTDFFVQTGLIFFFDLPRSKLFGNTVLGSIEFNVPKHVMDIVYSQTITWLAVFFAPLIVAVTVVKAILIYFYRLFYVRFICKPSSVPITATRASSYFQYCLLVAFTLCFLAVGQTIGAIEPSRACGPFRDVFCSETGGCNVYDYIINLIKSYEGSDELRSLILYLGEVTVLYPISLVLFVVSYLLWAYSFAQLKLIRQLKHQLKQIHREKQDISKKLSENE